MVNGKNVSNNASRGSPGWFVALATVVVVASLLWAGVFMGQVLDPMWRDRLTFGFFSGKNVGSGSSPPPTGIIPEQLRQEIKPLLDDLAEVKEGLAEVKRKPLRIAARCRLGDGRY